MAGADSAGTRGLKPFVNQDITNSEARLRHKLGELSLVSSYEDDVRGCLELLI